MPCITCDMHIVKKKKSNNFKYIFIVTGCLKVFKTTSGRLFLAHIFSPHYRLSFLRFMWNLVTISLIRVLQSTAALWSAICALWQGSNYLL